MINKTKLLTVAALCISIGGWAIPTTSYAMTKQQAIEIANYRNAQQALQKQIVNRYNTGLKAYASGNYSGCVQNLVVPAVSNRFGNKRDYNVALGDSYYHLQDYNHAITYLNKSYNLGGESMPLVNIDMGMSFYNMGNFKQAVNYLQKGANSNLANGDTLWALATAYDETGNKQGMLSTLELLNNRFPQYKREAYITVGMEYLDNKQFVAAIKVFQKGLNHFPNDADLLYWIGHTYYEYGNLEKAIPYLEKTNQLMPNNIDTLYDLGSAYLGTDRLDDAAACADIMVKVNKDHPKTQDLYSAVQQKIMQKQMEQQMQMDMINQQIQEVQEAANASMNMMTPAGM